MEIITPVQKRFMKRFERYEPVNQDHTAMITAKTCLRKYFYRIVLGRTPKRKEPFFTFGSAYHKFREVLEKTDDETKGLDAALNLWRREAGDKDPIAGSKFDWLTRAKLVETCIVAAETRAKEISNGSIEVIGSEENFVIKLKNGIKISGKADQIIRMNGRTWGRDFKTTTKDLDNTYTKGYYEQTLEPNDQVTRYTYAEGKLAGEQVYGQIWEVISNPAPAKRKKKGEDVKINRAPKIHRFMCGRTPTQLDVWEDEQIHFSSILDLCRTADVWPMQEKQCSYCEFRSVCKQPSEGAQMAKLESEFNCVPWDPTNRTTDDD